MSLRFKGADLRPVLTEAIANQAQSRFLWKGLMPERKHAAMDGGVDA